MMNIATWDQEYLTQFNSASRTETSETVIQEGNHTSVLGNSNAIKFSGSELISDELKDKQFLIQTHFQLFSWKNRRCVLDHLDVSSCSNKAATGSPDAFPIEIVRILSSRYIYTFVKQIKH